MKFCTECGHPLHADERFCTECGMEQIENSPANPLPTEVPMRSTNPVPKKPMDNKTKWILSIVATIGTLLIGSHLFLTSYLDPIKDLQEMDQAIATNDVETFFSHITLDEQSILDKKGYFEYIKDEWESIKEQSLHIFEDESPWVSHHIYNRNGEILFRVEQDKILFYETYHFHAIPTKLIGSTDMDHTNVQLADTTHMLETTDPIEIGNIYPGLYLIQAYTTNLFGKFEYESELEVYPREETEFAITFGGNKYPFNTNKEDGYLFVNGENTGMTFAELEFLGPIPNDADIEMHGEWTNADGEVIKTEVRSLADIGSYGFDFYFEEPIELEFEEETVTEPEMDEDTETNTETDTDIDSYAYDEDDLKMTVLDFRDAYEIALNSKDFSHIEIYLLEGSNAYNELKEYIEDLKTSTYHYDFHSNTIISAEMLEREHFLVTTNEKFTFTNHKGETIDYDRTKEYTLKKTDDTFGIMDITYVETNRSR